MRKKLRVLGEYVGQLVILVQWSEPVVSDAGLSQLMKFVEKIIIYSDVMFLVWWAIFST